MRFLKELKSRKIWFDKKEQFYISLIKIKLIPYLVYEVKRRDIEPCGEVSQDDQV